MRVIEQNIDVPMPQILEEIVEIESIVDISVLQFEFIFHVHSFFLLWHGALHVFLCLSFGFNFQLPRSRESTFHIAERIPEGTKRKHGVSLEKVAIPAEELTTDSVPLPVGPIAMWHAAMIRSYDMMMIEFTSGKSSWNIVQRTKHSSVARMYVREKPQSVRFMIIVTDPSNLSQREVIKVTREVTETIPLICAPQAPIEMVFDDSARANA